MTRRDRFLILLAFLAALQVGSVASSGAQPEFAWSRATVGLLSDDTPIGEERAQMLHEAGLDAVVWPGDPGDGSGWNAMTDLARKAGLRILLGVDGSEGSELAHGLALRAEKSGFDGVVAFSIPLDGVESKTDAFLVVAGESAFEHILSIPDGTDELDALFARRARSIGKPEAAAMAIPGAGLSELLLLLPGPVAVPESDMSDKTWTTLSRFRSRHPALADGVHGKLSDAPYAFFRGLRLDKGKDDMILVVIGAEGRIRLNVSSIYPDDVVLRDAISGAIALVSYGQLSLQASEGGLMLFELME